MGKKLPQPEGSDPTPVGDRIRAARNKLGFTQAQAAALMPGSLGKKPGAKTIGKQYWSDVENGRRKPSLEWLWYAAKALGINPHSLDERLASKRWPKPEKG